MLKTVKRVLTPAEKVELGDRVGKLYQENGRAKTDREIGTRGPFMAQA